MSQVATEALPCDNLVCEAYKKIDCRYVGSNASPIGIKVIPGAGNLTEYPISESMGNLNEGLCLINSFENYVTCPRYSEGSVCVRDCCEFKAAAKINYINGDLIIQDPRDLTDGSDDYTSCSNYLSDSCLTFKQEAVDVFPNLLGVNGNIVIVGTNYTRITGFERLRFVNGSIYILNNDKLKEMPKFENLMNIDRKTSMVDGELVSSTGSLIIANNISLHSVAGFDILRQVSDCIVIAANPNLQTIIGFNRLFALDRLIIGDNNRLNQVIGFCRVTNLANGLIFANNNTDCGGDLSVEAFGLLESVDNLVIMNNHGLADLNLSALLFANHVIIRLNDDLQSFQAALEKISGVLRVEYNKSLKVLAFPELLHVDSILSIAKNDSLEELNTFPLLRYTDGVIIAENRALKKIAGFDVLRYIGSFGIARNPDSTSVLCRCDTENSYAWDSATSSDCSYSVNPDQDMCASYSNAYISCAYSIPNSFLDNLCISVSACTGVPDQTAVDRDYVRASMVIYSNPRLQQIDAFNRLRNTASSIFITENKVLAEMHAFDMLIAAIDIWIRNNPSLVHIQGFSMLNSARDIVIRETPCLQLLDNFYCLMDAQSIVIDANTAGAILIPKEPIFTVAGYIIHYQYEKC